MPMGRRPCYEASAAPEIVIARCRDVMWKEPMSRKDWRTMANILIVEDDAALRTTLHDLLAAAGHQVVLAAKATQALDTIRRTNAGTVVLLDVRLPDGTGL